MPGTLNTESMAVLGSTIAWTKHESDTGRIAWVSGAYRILSEGENPRYWTATVRLDRDRVHLGAGAGELGLTKCVRLCERHAQTNSGVVANSPETRSPVARGTAPDPSNNDLSPQQQQLL